MSDEAKPNKGELIPSINRNLTRKKSGLAKRGLELIHELKKQQVRVLIGNFDDVLNDVFSEIIKKVIKDKYDLKLWSSFYGEEILKLADKESVDIFILTLNNIRFRPVYQERFEHVLQLITQIKMTYGRPMIALSGLKEDSFLIARAKLVADFYLQLPVKLDVFREAFENCLEMLPIFDKVLRKRFKGRTGHTIT